MWPSDGAKYNSGTACPCLATCSTDPRCRDARLLCGWLEFSPCEGVTAPLCKSSPFSSRALCSAPGSPPSAGPRKHQRLSGKLSSHRSTLIRGGGMLHLIKRPGGWRQRIVWGAWNQQIEPGKTDVENMKGARALWPTTLFNNALRWSVLATKWCMCAQYTSHQLSEHVWCQ